MQFTFLILASVTLAGLQLVHADHVKETTQYTFGAPKEGLYEARPLPKSRRSLSFSGVSHLKPAVKGKGKAREIDEPSVKKRVRFFIHEDGDLNLIDNQGQGYVSTDEERDADDNEYHFGTPSALQSPQASSGRHSPPPRSASWSATARQRAERVDEEQSRPSRENLGTDVHTISSRTMKYKADVTNQIRLAESKIEWLKEMIADQKAERCEATKYNLTRMKFVDFRQQNRIWNARIKLLKQEMHTQEQELDYWTYELMMVTRRLQNALLRSQRPHTFSR